MSVFTDRLSQRFQTLAPDLRGYGKSHPQGDFQMEDHLTDLEALLDRFNIDRCLVLGWSLGGILALELALRSPQRFSGLILVATAACPRSNHPPVSRSDLVCTGIAGIVNWVVPSWQWNIETFGRRSLFRYLLGEQTPTAYRYLASDAVSAYLLTSKAANRALNRALKGGYNRLEDLERIQAPALLLAGANDCHITPQSTQETAQSLPNSEYRCYPNTAHLCPWEIPNRILEDIENWLDRYPEIFAARSQLFPQQP